MYNSHQGRGQGQFQGRGTTTGLGSLSHGLLGPVVAAAAAGIGLASESIHHHKEKKAATKAQAAENSDSQPPPAYREESHGSEKSEKGVAEHEEHHVEEGDEEQWDLDDAQEQIAAQPPLIKKRPLERDPKKITQLFIDDYPIPQEFSLGQLSLPVILPQRRPKDRARGFIRAYAPELMHAGIDQSMFIDFLETFNLASQFSPWLNAINLAGLAFVALPTGISQAATVALYLAVMLAKNLQSKARYNTFLDQINDNFFRPRGLYCMVLTWNPESDDLNAGVNVNETVHSNITPPEGIAQKTTHKFRPSMGNTNGVVFTKTAPLVFPDLDQLHEQDPEEAKNKLAKLKHAQNFASEYFDRRAQAKYAGNNPDSKLVVGPKATFTSRYADPNNASNSGDILALLTGGRFSMPTRGGFGGFGGFGGSGGGRQMRGDYGGYGGRRGLGGGYGGQSGGVPLKDRFAMAYAARGIQPNQQYQQQYQQQYPNQQYQNQQGHQQQYPNQQSQAQQYLNMGAFALPMALGDGVKRILRHHVLYLLIVNMPSDEELAHATSVMDQTQQQTQ